MSEGKEIKSTSRRGFGQSLKDISTSRARWWVIGLVLVLASTPLWFPLLNSILGDPFNFEGRPPVVEDVEYHVGYCSFTVYARNGSGEYNQVNATMELIDYYNTSTILQSDVQANGSVYYVSNVTLLWINMVDPNPDGFIYPNGSFMVYANTTVPYENKIYLNCEAKPADIDITMYKLDGSYGDFALGDIASVNFTCSLQITNNGNGTLGESNYIPLCHRYNSSVGLSGLWMKVDKIVNSIVIPETSYEWKYNYDGSGNTYIYLFGIQPNDDTTVGFTFYCDAIPTELKFINGQWNGSVINTFV